MNAPALHPSHDPDFVDRCLWDLFSHPGEWRQLGRLYAEHVPSFDRCCLVRDAVEVGRRMGFEIEGDRQRGYRVTGFTRRRPRQLAATHRPTLRLTTGTRVTAGQLSLV